MNQNEPTIPIEPIPESEFNAILTALSFTLDALFDDFREGGDQYETLTALIDASCRFSLDYAESCAADARAELERIAAES